MRSTTLLVGAALAGTAALLVATPTGQAAPTSRPAPPRAATYQIDGVHSGALFRITHNGVAPFWGRFNSIRGEYVLDEETPGSSSVTVEIDADSVDTNSPDRDKHIKSPDFFNAKEHRTITFTSTEVSKTGDDTFRITGDLDFHGVTKEVECEATKIGESDTRQGYRSGFEVELTIDRNDFGVKAYPGGLGAEVRLILFVEGARQ